MAWIVAVMNSKRQKEEQATNYRNIRSRKDVDSCKAVIYHGSGHQSKTYCEIIGTHKIHFAKYGRFETPCYWRGDEAMTDFFDRPPEFIVMREKK